MGSNSQLDHKKMQRKKWSRYPSRPSTTIYYTSRTVIIVSQPLIVVIEEMNCKRGVMSSVDDQMFYSELDIGLEEEKG